MYEYKIAISPLKKTNFENIELSESEKQFNRIYRIHKYWARKPWHVVQSYVRRYSSENDLVVDPFVGSGVTGLESIINNRNFIGIDLNPMSKLITETTLKSDVDLKELSNIFNSLKEKLEEKIQSLYEVNEVCSKCNNKKVLRHLILDGDKKGSAKIYCRYCKDRAVESEHRYKELNVPDKLWTPNKEFPEQFYKDRFSYKGIKTVDDFYTKRNLYSLSLIFDEIKNIDQRYKNFFIIAFTNTLLHVSKLKSENVRPMSVNNYWIPGQFIEENVWFRFEERFNLVLVSKKTLHKRIKNKKLGDFKIIKEDSTTYKLDAQVDYIFTDPPYGETIQYSELSYIWNAWIEKEYQIKNEVIINPKQDKGLNEFNDLLSNSIDNIYRMLKDEAYFTLCFNNKDSEVWERIITHCKNIGFRLYDISIYDMVGSPYNKNWAKFSPKSDIYVTFIKSHKVNNELYFNKKQNLNSLIEDVINYFENNQVVFSNSDVYNYVVSLLIWSMFYNETEIDIDNFSIKTISDVINE